MMKTVLYTRLLSVKIDHVSADDVKAKILESPPVSKHQSVLLIWSIKYILKILILSDTPLTGVPTTIEYGGRGCCGVAVLPSAVTSQWKPCWMCLWFWASPPFCLQRDVLLRPDGDRRQQKEWILPQAAGQCVDCGPFVSLFVSVTSSHPFHCASPAAWRERCSTPRGVLYHQLTGLLWTLL